MKIFISTDMEGLPGVNAWHQVNEKDPRYLGKYMAEALEWVLEGIKSSDLDSEVEQILVCDSHSIGENLSYDFTEKDDRLYLVRGGLRDYYMMAGIDSTFSTVFFVGYHAGVGAIHGTMDHTYSLAVHDIKVNGVHMSESTINGAFAGHYGVPVSLVVGDHALVEELHPLMPDTVMVETKTGLSRYAAIMKPKNVVKREVIESTKLALVKTAANRVKPYKLEAPYTLEMVFNSTDMVDESLLVPGTERVNGHTLRFRSDSYPVTMQTMLALLETAYVGTKFGK